MKKLTFHLVALPHTQVTQDYFHCAYTAKVHGFTRMMMSLGHTVYLYAGEETTAEPTESLYRLHWNSTVNDTKFILNIPMPSIPPSPVFLVSTNSP